MEKRGIESLSIVISVRFHTLDKTHKEGLYTNLRCCVVFSIGDCGTNLVGSILMSSECPTPVDYLRELARLIQRDHGPTSVKAQKLQSAEKNTTDRP